MHWFRVDNRLIHGQIIETWIPYTNASRLLVCNDMLSADTFHQQILLLAVPYGIDVRFTSLASLPLFSEWFALESKNTALVVFENLEDARSAFCAGFHFSCLNIGNIHYGPERKHICHHVALSAQDKDDLDYFTEQGVALDFRSVPNDQVQVRGW